MLLPDLHRDVQYQNTIGPLDIFITGEAIWIQKILERVSEHPLHPPLNYILSFYLFDYSGVTTHLVVMSDEEY